MTGDAELPRLRGRRRDAHAEDRQVREPASQAQGMPHVRARSRFQEHDVGDLVRGQLALADRSVTEPQDENLE